MPSTGTSTLRNMLRPFLASIRARSWGVETITAPDSGVCWASVNWASPVPEHARPGRHRLRSPGDPQKTRHGGAVDIGIEHAHLVAVGLKAERQVDGGG